MSTMPMFNHFGITNLYFSEAKTKYVKFILSSQLRCFTDALYLVAHDSPCLRVVLNNIPIYLFVWLFDTMIQTLRAIIFHAAVCFQIHISMEI